MRSAGILPAAVLLLAACAAPEPDPAPPAAPSSAGLVQDGPVRMRITGSYTNRDPDGRLTVVFDTILEAADGKPLPPNRWFFEHAMLNEDYFLVPGGRTWTSDDFAGMGSGWSSKSHFMLKSLPPETRGIRRVAVDIPMLEILEGEFEEIRLAEGAEQIRVIGTGAFEFEAADGGLQLFRYAASKGAEEDEGEDDADEQAEEDPLPVDGFYGVGSRDFEHAWEITDAAGRPFVCGMGMGTGVFTHDWYHRDPRVGGKVEYPLIVRWRVPRRWRATMQRFVFENLVVPAPEPEREPTPPPEEK